MSATSTSESLSVANSSVVRTTEITTQLKPISRIVEVVSRTSTDSNSPQEATEAIAEAHRIYPHVFDEATNTGEALGYIREAIQDARDALDDFGEVNLQSIGMRLSQIAQLLKKAYSISHANDPFAAVISFLRRAALTLSPEDITLPQLNSLLGALKQIADNPLLSLDEATDLIENLSSNGWTGEHEAVEQIVKMLIDAQGQETVATIEAMKKLLTPEGTH